MSATARRTLRSGDLRFSADEAGEGPTVLCIHGFPDHRGSWRHQLPALAEAGYHAIAPNLRGYEPSSQPRDGDYHLSTLGEDVAHWLDDLGGERAHLVGHDWGAAVATVAANLVPDRIASLTTVAVPPLRRIGAMLRAHPDALARLWYMVFFQLRVAPERALLVRDGALIRRLWADWAPTWTCPEPAMRAVLDTLSQPGVPRAVLAYYRHLPDLITGAGRRSWRLLRGRVKVPTLAVTGALDGCMKSALYDIGVRTDDFSAGVTVQRFDDAGHFLHQEKPDAFNQLLIDWLSRHG